MTTLADMDGQESFDASSLGQADEVCHSIHASADTLQTHVMIWMFMLSQLKALSTPGRDVCALHCVTCKQAMGAASICHADEID